MDPFDFSFGKARGTWPQEHGWLFRAARDVARGSPPPGALHASLCTPTSDRCATLPALTAGKKLAAAISPPEPLRTFLEELTRGRGPAVQVGAPRAALHAVIAAEVLTPATRSAYTGRWVGKQYGARGKSATGCARPLGRPARRGERTVRRIGQLFADVVWTIGFGSTARFSTASCRWAMALIIVGAFLPPRVALGQATFVVEVSVDRPDASPGDGMCADVVGFCTLRAAIMEANAIPTDDRIVFAVTGPIVLGSTLPEVADARSAGALEIDGGGQVTLSGNDRVQILRVANGGNLTLRNIRLERGGAWDAGAIYSGGTLTIENSTFSENSGYNGGAIYSSRTLTIENSTFSGNSARNGQGGAIYSEGTLTIANSTFSGNSTNSYQARGGAIYSSGTLTIENSTFSGNSASSYQYEPRGGAIYSSGTLTITNSTFSGNSAGSDQVWGGGGGAIYSEGTLTIANSTFSGNSTNSYRAGGGAIYSSGTLTIENSAFSGNSTNSYWAGGGAIYSSGTLTIENSTFSGNSALSLYGRGGAIYAEGTLTVGTSSFSENSAQGGGAISSSRTLSIENSTFSRNSASESGGAIVSSGALQAVGVRISDNQAGAYGGGLSLWGTADIRASTLARNTSRSCGGVSSNGEVRLLNVTFSENAATEDGGAVCHSSLDTLADVVFTTFYLNAAGGRGAAIFDGAASTRIKNSIVLGSRTSGNCFGTLLSRGRNYSTDDTCSGFTVATSDELRLDVLADNGGPTETHALLSGSVAIDSAPDCNDLRGGAVDSDQRGASRPWGVACDVGAYEAGAPAPPSGPTRTPTPTRTRTPTPTPTPTPTRTPTAVSQSPSPTPPLTATPPGEGAAVIVGNVTGAPDTEVTFQVRLQTGEDSVAGIQHDISFDPAFGVIPPNASSRPDCSANPSIGKENTQFAYLPVGCTPGTGCTGIRAVVASNSNASAIPDGSLLYTCKFRIAATARGTSVLTTSGLVGSDPEGRPVWLSGVNGSVTVFLPTPTPTHTTTPTHTPTLTRTATPSATPTATLTGTPTTTPTPSPTETPVSLCPGDCNGNGEVTIDELVMMVNIALGARPLSDCEAGDSTRDGEITIDEIIRAVTRALSGC